jgi:hydrogenase expression/formation protein HypD
MGIPPLKGLNKITIMAQNEKVLAKRFVVDGAGWQDALRWVRCPRPCFPWSALRLPPSGDKSKYKGKDRDGYAKSQIRQRRAQKTTANFAPLRLGAISNGSVSMAIKHAEEYREAGLARPLIAKIKKNSDRPIRLMEVCGTHTMAIFRHGIRQVLPPQIGLLSGPGCPVCVTDQGEIDAFIELARRPDVIITTFGDLIRVPGSGSSLQKERAAGRQIQIVYSTFDALDIAKANLDKKVVFLGVGFETTAPTIAAAILTAARTGVTNFFVISAHKIVPPALAALVANKKAAIDGFILPGHVSVIIGTDAYRPLFERCGIPAVVTGFEPADILNAIGILVEQIHHNRPALANAYSRAVTDQGNPKAVAMMAEVFETVDARWRGIGVIAASGLDIREAYGAFDARRHFGIQVQAAPEPKGCACGAILTGTLIPPQCHLFKKKCTPQDPVGPCMVSSEGTCAAYYRYHVED